MIRETNITYDNPYKKQIECIIDDEKRGYLEYSTIYDRMEIDNIFVLEEYRSQGIGTKLMSYLVSIAIEMKMVNITLEVRRSNLVAINLYKKFGFREVALRKGYYEDFEDAILMEKQVM